MSTEFVMLSRTVEGFVSDCEKVCGRRSTSLRSSLQGQVNISWASTVKQNGSFNEGYILKN